MAKYFSSLNYTYANEDTSLEFELVRYFQSPNILSVCGSGSRALPLLHDKAKILRVVDMVERQLQLARLRYLLIKRIEFDDYLKFLGHTPYHPSDHCQWRQNISHELSIPLELLAEFRSLKWESPLFQGKWEKTFAFLSRLVQLLLGHHARRLFEFTDLSAQRRYLQEEFPWGRWHFLLRILGQRAVFNALLYKGDFVKKNVPVSYFLYYSEAFEHLMQKSLARESFFLQLCFLGEVPYAEGRLIEARPECFSQMKRSQASVEFICGDLIQVIQAGPGLDFISLSDVPSYFAGARERDFLQTVRSHLNPGGVVVLRSYLRVPQADRSGFVDLAPQFSQLISAEKVQMYKIEILQRVS
jgi:S-adenosylmethionine-diacylglycerol 3-amino-3-carboxypropyl transferase